LYEYFFLLCIVLANYRYNSNKTRLYFTSCLVYIFVTIFLSYFFQKDLFTTLLIVDNAYAIINQKFHKANFIFYILAHKVLRRTGGAPPLRWGRGEDRTWSVRGRYDRDLPVRQRTKNEFVTTNHK